MKKFINLTFVTILGVFLLVGCGDKKSQIKDNQMRGQATGYAHIYDGDVSLARDRAIDNAMNTLVKTKLGTTISGRQLVEDYVLVENIIEAKSSGMVKNWDILAEGQEGVKTYKVTIEGEVFPAAVNDTIQQTLANYGKPKFMVLINEEIISAKKKKTKTNPGNTTSEMILMDKMGNAGFEFIDAEITNTLLKKEAKTMKQVLSGKVSTDAQNLLLNNYGAEVVLLGTAKISDQTETLKRQFPQTTMKSKRVQMSLKAVDLYTGKILASTVKNAAGAGIDDGAATQRAIESCLRLIVGGENDRGQFKSGPFMNTLTKKFLIAATKRPIMMTITGLEYSEISKFRNQLQERVRGISAVYPRGQNGKAALLEVEFAGKTNDLADELKGKAKNLGWNIKINQVYPNKINLSAQKIK